MPNQASDRSVLFLIAAGLILILLGIIAGIFLMPRTPPNWAENVLVAIASAAALKLGDCLSTLVALSSGRSVERLGTQLANTQPVTDMPQPVQVVNTDEEPVPTTLPEVKFGDAADLAAKLKGDGK